MSGYKNNGGKLANGTYGKYIENCAGLDSGTYSKYIENNNSSASTTVINFKDYFTTANILQSVQSDLGVTLNGSTVSAWADQSANGNNYAQATASKQPLITTGINGFPGILFDGVDDTLDNSTLNAPAPNVTPFYVFGVFRNVTWLLNSWIVGNGSGGANIGIISQLATPDLSIRAGFTANTNSSVAINNWECTEAYFSGSVSDYLRRGATTVAGATAGTNAIFGRQIGNSNSSVGTYSNCEVLALVYLNALPSPGQISAARAAVTAKYGVSVAV